MSRIFVTGDTHGLWDVEKFEPENFPIYEDLTKEDYMIVLGDMGVCWDGCNEDKLVREKYKEYPWTTLFIDGNHENFDLLEKYPVEEWHGGQVHKISDSIIHLMRGQVFELNGKKYFTFGGARSIDRQFRKEGESWWRQEMPTEEEYELGLETLNRINYLPNYILTHAAPTFYLQELNPYFRPDELTRYLGTIEYTIGYDHWYCGHYHLDRSIGRKFTCLYNDIKEIE